MVEIKKWYDGGFRTEHKRYFSNPCDAIGCSIILKKYFYPDENCNIKKVSARMKKI